jgi:hypothetical protein
MVRVMGAGQTCNRRNDAFDAAAFGPASIQTDKPADELGAAFFRFLFAIFRKPNSTRLWFQYSIFEIQFLRFLRCPEGIELSRHPAIHPRRQCPGFSRWNGNIASVVSNRRTGGRVRAAWFFKDAILTILGCHGR